MGELFSFETRRRLDTEVIKPVDPITVAINAQVEALRAERDASAARLVAEIVMSGLEPDQRTEAESLAREQFNYETQEPINLGE